MAFCFGGKTLWLEVNFTIVFCLKTRALSPNITNMPISLPGDVGTSYFLLPVSSHNPPPTSPRDLATLCDGWVGEEMESSEATAYWTEECSVHHSMDSFHLSFPLSDKIGGT